MFNDRTFKTGIQNKSNPKQGYKLAKKVQKVSAGIYKYSWISNNPDEKMSIFLFPAYFRLHYSQKLTFANSLICVSYPRFSAFTTIFYKFFRPQQDFSRILQQSRICFTAHFTRVARIARYFAASAAYKDRVLLPSDDCNTTVQSSQARSACQR